jgi:ubiquinol-cytochrome c reductase cytochrome c subunit
LRDRIVVVACSMAVGCAAVALWFACRPGLGHAEIMRDNGILAVRHIYLRDCASCHGPEGRGTDLGPDLHHAGEGLIDYEVSTGRMPLPSAGAPHVRRSPKYPPATIRALVEYVAELTGGAGTAIPVVDPREGSVPVGGSLYRINCAACHAWSGNGGALLDREAPSTHRATPVQIAEAVRAGPGNMPAFGLAALTDRQLQSVVRYVRYLDHPDDRGGTPLWHLGPLAEGAVAVFVGLGLLVLASRWIGTRT